MLTVSARPYIEFKCPEEDRRFLQDNSTLAFHHGERWREIVSKDEVHLACAFWNMPDIFSTISSLISGKVQFNL